jgi:hypothetical protein
MTELDGLKSAVTGSLGVMLPADVTVTLTSTVSSWADKIAETLFLVGTTKEHVVYATTILKELSHRSTQTDAVHETSTLMMAVAAMSVNQDFVNRHETDAVPIHAMLKDVDKIAKEKDLLKTRVIDTCADKFVPIAQRVFGVLEAQQNAACLELKAHHVSEIEKLSGPVRDLERIASGFSWKHNLASDSDYDAVKVAAAPLLAQELEICIGQVSDLEKEIKKATKNMAKYVPLGGFEPKPYKDIVTQAYCTLQEGRYVGTLEDDDKIQAPALMVDALEQLISETNEVGVPTSIFHPSLWQRVKSTLRELKK